MDLITEDTPYRTMQLCARHNGRILARVVEDSFANDDNRTRLTTLEVVVPRIVLAEFNTHRAFSRNSASSRAIPIEKMLKRVQEDPYIPETWGKNQKGMQAEEALDEDRACLAREVWLGARDAAVEHTKELLEVGVHKQTTNRLLEPFMWHTIIVTATEWSNFRHLRAHGDAHPAIQNTARAVIAVLDASDPDEVDWEEWHLPFVHERDKTEIMDAVGVDVKISDRSYAPAQLSTARCARVSYLTHDGIRELSKDFSLHDSLLGNGHMSPFEHAAFASETYSLDTASNFAFPWVQYRKLIPYESDVYADPDREWKAAE